jgi:hypothetical protein
VREEALRLGAGAGQVGGDGVPDGVVAHDARVPSETGSLKLEAVEVANTWRRDVIWNHPAAGTGGMKHG